MDVKCAFLNGYITKYIYMQNPQGFFTNPSLVCRINKSLYGLKQAPRAWYEKIDGFLLSLSFVWCKYDPNVYLNLMHGSLMIIFLYVDDLLITGSSKKQIASLKDAMNHAFSMTDLGLLSQFFGSRNCSIPTWNKSTSVQVWFGFTEQVQHERLQAKKDWRSTFFSYGK